MLSHKSKKVVLIEGAKPLSFSKRENFFNVIDVDIQSGHDIRGIIEISDVSWIIDVDTTNLVC